MDKPDNNESGTPKLIPPHGGYRDLKSYQMAEIIHDATVVFCDRFIDPRSRTQDQMVQAARSGTEYRRGQHCFGHFQKERTEAYRGGACES